MSRLEGSRSAWGPAKNRHIVDSHQQRLAFHVGEAHIEIVGQAVLRGTVDVDLIELGLQARPQPIAQSTEPLRFFGHLLLSKLAGLAQSDDAGDVERAGTHTALVAAAIDDGGKLYTRGAPPNVQRAYTLWSVDLLRGKVRQVDIVLLHLHRDLADRLHAIHSQDDAVFLGALADLRHRIDHANLVVGGHDGDQNRLRRNRLPHVFGVNAPIALHRQISHLVSVLFQPLAGIEHSLVLNGLRDDVVALLAVHLRAPL